jgi:putative MATE family efflux protein
MWPVNLVNSQLASTCRSINTNLHLASNRSIRTLAGLKSHTTALSTLRNSNYSTLSPQLKSPAVSFSHLTRHRQCCRHPRCQISCQAVTDSNQEDINSTIASKKSLDAEIFNIALSTLATLAADPLAALVSTAWVGQLGAVQLAGVGVALSVYGAFTKLFNMPLLAVITSSTASALGRGQGEGSRELGGAVTSALALALGVGLVQALLLGGLGISGLSTWGAGPSSPLYDPAVHYLSVRALGAPTTVLFLALQGAFRGLGDTRAPFVAIVIANLVNIALEPLFIFTLGWGVRGAAAAVVVSQLVSVLGLAAVLTKRLNLGSLDTSVLKNALEYVKPTGLLTLRTLAITATFSLATALSSRTDASHAAAHQIAFQLWLASSLLSDSLAVAAQSLIARSLAAGTAAGRAAAALVSRRILNLSIKLGLTLAAGLTIGTVVLPLTSVFSSDPAVLAVLTFLMPIVISLQPVNALAFTMDGLLYGVNGFAYAAKAMTLSAIPAIATMVVGMRFFVGSGAAPAAAPVAVLLVVWAGLAVVMVARFLTIFIPYTLRKKPFDVIDT